MPHSAVPPSSQRRATNLARTRSGSVKVKARAPLPRPICSRMRREHAFGESWTPNAYSAPMSNFTRLDPNRSDVAILVDAMLRAREVGRPWSTSQEPTTENWWADVLADPRARIRRQPGGLYVRDSKRTARKSHYRLADEPGPVIEVACSKCEWKAGQLRTECGRPHHAAVQQVAKPTVECTRSPLRGPS